MAISPLAGHPAPKELIIDVTKLIRDYYERKPDLADQSRPSHSEQADIADRLSKVHSPSPMSWQLHRRFVIIAGTRVSMARSIWVRTLTHSPRRPNEPRWRCSQGMEWTPLSRWLMVSRRRR